MADPLDGIQPQESPLKMRQLIEPVPLEAQRLLAEWEAETFTDAWSKETIHQMSQPPLGRLYGWIEPCAPPLPPTRAVAPSATASGSGSATASATASGPATEFGSASATESGSATEWLGFALTWQVLDTVELHRLIIAPQARRQGIGGAFLSALMQNWRAQGFQQVQLEVRASNLAARTLYEAKGFYPVHRRVGYYEQPKEDAILYTADLH